MLADIIFTSLLPHKVTELCGALPGKDPAKSVLLKDYFRKPPAAGLQVNRCLRLMLRCS